MTEAAKLNARLRVGAHPGLPARVHSVPFSNQSRCRDEFGLMPSQIKIVVAVVAAEFAQLGPVTAREIGHVIGTRSMNVMAALVRAGWIEVVGYVPQRTSRLYAPTARAWNELGLAGWSLLKEVA